MLMRECDLDHEGPSCMAHAPPEENENGIDGPRGTVFLSVAAWFSFPLVTARLK